MELFAILSFLSTFIPLIIIIAVVKSIGSALFNPKNGSKSTVMSKYQEFMKEVNQEKDRLGNVPDKKEAVKQELSRVNQKAANQAKQRNNPYLSKKKNQYQQPKVKSEPLADRNRIQTVSQSEAMTHSYSDTQIPVKGLVQSKKQLSKKKKKQTALQKELLKGIIYKEILDKPRALRSYR